MKLYRYRNYESPYFFEEMKMLLKESKFYFVNRKNLNDPIDCLPNLTNGINSDELYKFLIPFFREIFQFYDDEKNLIYSPENKERGFWRDIIFGDNPANKKISLLRNYTEERMLANFVMVCFTDSALSNLMWSHYGNSFSGLCIEFEVNIPDAYDQQIPFVSGADPLPQFAQVEYVSEPSTISVGSLFCIFISGLHQHGFNVDEKYKQFAAQFFETLRFTHKKTKEWEYEREWRKIKSVDKEGYFKINGVRVDSLIFGQNAQKNEVEKIRKTLFDWGYDIPMKKAAIDRATGKVEINDF